MIRNVFSDWRSSKEGIKVGKKDARMNGRFLENESRKSSVIRQRLSNTRV